MASRSKLPIGNVENSTPGIAIIDATRPENCWHFLCSWACAARIAQTEAAAASSDFLDWVRNVLNSLEK